MANALMYGPSDRTKKTIQVNGRSYTYVAGTALSVPEFDAIALEANGWIRQVGTSGTTAQRPTGVTLTSGTRYMDTTVGALLIWMNATDGWVHHATGAVSQ